MNVVLKENVVDDTLGIFEYLHAIDIEYRKQYKGMYGRQMTVPRGQASFTISDCYVFRVSARPIWCRLGPTEFRGRIGECRRL